MTENSAPLFPVNELQQEAASTESLPDVLNKLLAQYQGIAVSLLRDNGLSRVVQYKDDQGDRMALELRTWLKTLEIHNELGVYAFACEENLMDLLESEAFEQWVKAQSFEELPEALARDYDFRYRPAAPRALASLKSEIKAPNLHILYSLGGGIQAARAYKAHVATLEKDSD